MIGFNFCTNCGFKLNVNDNFCSNCGVKVGGDNSEVINDDDFFLKYKIKIENLKDEYDLKVSKAIEFQDTFDTVFFISSLILTF